MQTWPFFDRQAAGIACRSSEKRLYLNEFTLICHARRAWFWYQLIGLPKISYGKTRESGFCKNFYAKSFSWRQFTTISAN